MSQEKIDILKRSLIREKAARKAAELILEDKSRELYFISEELKQANFKLGHLLEEKSSQLEGVFENIVDAYVVIDIKKNTTTNAAVKAATRYIQNSEDIKCILYIKSNLLKNLEDKKKQIELLKIIETQFKQALYNHKSSKDLKKIFSYKELLSFQKIN